MADIVKAYADNSGAAHKTAEGAVMADLSAAFGAKDGIGPNIAKLVLEHRAAIEKAFSDLDRLTAVPLSEKRLLRDPLTGDFYDG